MSGDFIRYLTLIIIDLQSAVLLNNQDESDLQLPQIFPVPVFLFSIKIQPSRQ